MPGQEKMVMEFYQKNPSALASLRGNVYEEKIISLIKTKAKSKKVNLTKEEADKLLKEECRTGFLVTLDGHYKMCEVD